MSKFAKNAIFFIGWLLSPLTFWNDAFLNIPISYLCASFAARVVRADFMILVLIFYWLSNGVGVLMMILSGKSIMQDNYNRLKTLINLLITMAVYSAIIIILNVTGVLKPI